MSHKTPYRFDGHGVNDAEGQRLATLSTAAYDYSSGQPQRNAEHDRLGSLFAAAPAMYAALAEISSWRGLAEQNKDDALLTITRVAINALKQADGQPQRNPEHDRLGHLFAAAPEMLEALEAFVRDRATCPTRNGQDLQAWEMMVVAIAKATTHA